MVDLFDPETGLPVENPQAPEDDFLSGKLSLPKDQPVNLYDPVTKKTIQADTSKVVDALNLGMKFETPQDEELRKFKNNPDNQGFIPAIKTFGAQLADEFALGIPETGLDIYQGENSTAYKERQITKEQNPIANFFGGTTGFALSLMYGGPVWKGVGKVGEIAAAPIAKLAAAGVAKEGLSKFAAQVGENAVKYGAEGALLSTPKAIEESILGDHDSVAEALIAGGEDLATGTLGGALLGAGGTTLAKTLKASSEIFGDVASSEKLQKYADVKKLRAAGLKQTDINKIISGDTANGIEDTASFLADNDLVGFKAMREGSEARLEKLQGIVKENGKGLQQIYDKIDGTGIKVFDPSLVSEKLGNLAEGYTDAVDKKFAKQIGNILETVQSRGEKPISFNDAQALVTKIGKYAFPKGLITKDMSAAQEAYGILKTELSDSMDLAASAMKEPEFADLYSTTKKNISIAKQLEAPFEKAFATHMGNNTISLTDYIAAAGAAGATGSIPATIASLAGNMLKRNYGDFVTYKLLEHAATGVDAIESRFNSALNSSLGLSKTVENIKPASVNFLKDYLGDRYDKNDKLENLKRFQGDINTFMNDSNASIGSLNLLSNKYGEAAPKISEAMKAKATNAINYLAQEMPKAKNPLSGVDTRTYRPSDFEIASFERKAQAVFDPMSVIRELKSGAVTSDQIDAIKTVYPQLFKAIQSKVLEKINTAPNLMPYGVKNKMLKLLDLNPDGFDRRTNTVQLQRNFRTNFTPKPNANSKITLGKGVGTEVDRIANR